MKPWMWWGGALCGGLLCSTVAAQTVVETFEYASDDELLAVWMPGGGNTTLSVSDEVAPQSSGQKAMRVQFNFPSTAWATEYVRGPELTTPVTIGDAQYITLRIKGDPVFASADFRNFYVYAYDAYGNFGRWGTATPITADWQVFNFLASGIAQPWNSPGLPDLSQIIRFDFFQYGSETAIPAYTATILLDELVIRDEPLTDTPPVVESVIEAFEYGDDGELQAAWTPSGNTVVSLSTAIAPASPGQTAMRAQFSFPSSAWATEVITGPELSSPVSIAASQYVVLRLKGDPAFAAADFRDFYLYAYDMSGNFGRWGTSVPATSDWQVFNFLASTIAKPWNSPALPDLGKIVRFDIYQYGSEAAIAPYTASIEVDDIMVRNTPVSDVPLTETVVEDFEYESDEALLAAWSGSVNTLLATSDSVAPESPGQKSMSMNFTFATGEWTTDIARGPLLGTPVAIGPKQYVTLRIKGDPAFAASDFSNFYIYAYDATGNFGRWGTPVPQTDTWQILNFQAGTIAQPWDSPALPDLGRIVRFSFFQYGSQAALPEYTATVQVDDLMIRNAPLFPAPAPARSLLDDFEGYAHDAALLAAYTYQNSPDTTVTTASLETPAPQGTKALKLAIDFAEGQYPWGSVRSPIVAPFSFPANGVVTLRFKGDPTLAALADAGTSFWLSFYDQQGGRMDFIANAPVVSSDWATLEARLADFGDTTAVDVGNLVQWRLLVQAYQGTAAHLPISAVFSLDDIRIGTAPVTPPALTIAREGQALRITASDLVIGKVYELLASADLKQWTAGAPITATATTATWTVPSTQQAEFFRVASKN